MVRFVFQEDDTGEIVGNGLERRKTGGRGSYKEMDAVVLA